MEGIALLDASDQVQVGVPEVAATGGYQEPDVEWHDLNEETLRRIEQGDGGVAGLIVSPQRMDANHWAKASRIGNAIGDSRRLRKLEIENFLQDEDEDHDVVNSWLFEFLRELARNRSIEHLEVVEFHYPWNPIIFISPFIEHNRNLRCIEIHACDLSGEHFPSFLSALNTCETNQLERIHLEDNNLGGRQITRLIKALRGQRNLREIHLCGNRIFKSGFVELSGLLQQSHSKIRVLEIGENTFGRQNINDECITILTSALVVNKTIKVLDVGGRNVTATGWRIFSGVICSPFCSLESLALSGNDLDDESFTVIGESLAKRNTVTSIDLRCNSHITSAGWQGFSKCLRNATCSLRDLNISYCELGDSGANEIAGALAVNTSLNKLNICNSRLGDAGANEIAGALAVNSSLKSLNMDHNESITATGWVSFFNRIIDSTCSLEELHIRSNQIDDQGASALVNLLARMSTIRLELGFSNSISTNGWTAFAQVLRTDSKLKTLDIGGVNFNDDVVVDFATALADNTSLNKLGIRGSITDRIWTAFSRILCDLSCVESTYLSNHTLHTLAINMWDMEVPENLARVVQMNTNGDKVALARQKIIAYHFSGDDVNIQAFAAMAVPILPHAIEWIGRDLLGFSLMYHFTGGVTALFE